MLPLANTTHHASGLMAAEIAISISLGVYTDGQVPTNLANNLISALFLVSLATTVSTTFLIGYRIHTATRQCTVISKNKFKYIVVMIIESAVVASLNLLIFAIVTMVPSFNDVNSPEFVVPFYDDAIANAISVRITTSIRIRTLHNFERLI